MDVVRAESGGRARSGGLGAIDTSACTATLRYNRRSTTRLQLVARELRCGHANLTRTTACFVLVAFCFAVELMILKLCSISIFYGFTEQLVYFLSNSNTIFQYWTAKQPLLFRRSRIKMK